MGNEYLLLSSDAQRALEEFSQDFAAALVQTPVEQWAQTIGAYKQSKALKTTYPIPVSAAGYMEFKGDVKYRSLFEKSISLSPKTWQDGVAALASVVEAPDFIGFGSEPAAMAGAAMSLLNEIIATLLEANAVQLFDGKAFFAGDHPCNIFDASVGTFDNDITGAGTDSTIANLKLAKQYFRDIKAPNGKSLGLRMTHVMVPAELEEVWRDILDRDMVLDSLTTAGTTGFGPLPNRHKGTVKLVVSDELTNALQWYPLALNKPGMLPWVVQDDGAPEEIINDKSSEMYKSTLKIGIAMIKRANGGLLLPQCIQRWAGTAP